MAKVTTLTIQNSKPKEKDYKIYDSDGLFIIIKTNGKKWWRFRYTLSGKQKTLSLGTYPSVSLKQAREERDKLISLIRSNQDPSVVRKNNKLYSSNKHTFEEFAHSWYANKKNEWTEKHQHTVLRRLELYLFPQIGHMNIDDITPKTMITVIKNIESKGIIESAHRSKSIASQVFKFAIAMDQCQSDPTRDISAALTTPRAKPFPTLTQHKDISKLAHKIDKYTGNLITRSALQLGILFFVRPGELVGARWNEFNFDSKQWIIPSERMKMKKPHIVPLSQQASDIIKFLKTYTDDSEFLFPSPTNRKVHMSRETLRGALRRMGYETGELTTHSFRSIATTQLYEAEWSPAVVERQLAHTITSKVRASYDYSQRLTERAEMMQWWADEIERIKIKYPLY